MNAEPSNCLDKAETSVYHRQILLPEIGEAGQMKLKNARVLVVGLGGLGSSAALYLAAAGVGTMGLLDGDRVEASNPQRQILHGADDVGRKKTASAGETIWAANPRVNLELYSTTLNDANAADILAEFDLVLGCVDNFAARYAINQACVRLNKANVFGAAAGWEGQASLFCVEDGPCYRCFFRDAPLEQDAEREKIGVVGTSPGIIGCIQANEAIKFILGAGDSLSGRLLLYDGLRLRFREIAIRKDDDCPACGRNHG